MDVWTGYSYDSIPHLLEKYGPRSVDLVFMDQKGTRFHSDLALMEELRVPSVYEIQAGMYKPVQKGFRTSLKGEPLPS